MSINSIPDLAQFRRDWGSNLILRVMTESGSPRGLYAKVPWLEPNFSDFDKFIEVLKDTIRNLPKEQVNFDPEFVMLTEEEIPRFCQTYGKTIYNICKSEGLRVTAELTNGVPAARKAMGYDGPEEGFALPLAYMVLDAIVDMRRYQKYRLETATRKGILPDEVKVPLQLGRSYDHPEWFVRCEDVPRELAKLPQKRIIKIMLNDPYSEKGAEAYPGEKIRELIDYIQKSNIERALHLFKNLEAMRDHSRHDRALIKSIRNVLDRFSLEIELGQKALERLLQNRSEEMKVCEAHLKAQNLPRGEYRRQIIDVRDRLNSKIDLAVNMVRAKRKEFLNVFHDTYPALAAGSFISIAEILDQETALFLFSIGADGVPILHLDGIGFRRTHSEQLQGKNMYAGGEMRFVRHEEVFHDYYDWERFDAKHRARTDPYPWSLRELNDGSGHYEPDPICLPYAGRVIFPLLNAVGISTSKCEFRDGVAPLLRLRGFAYFDGIRNRE